MSVGLRTLRSVWAESESTVVEVGETLTNECHSARGAPHGGHRAAEADRIVFSGVRFVVETAKIVNPNKTVPLPAEEADHSGSTSSMIDYVESTDAESYVLLTECSMGDNIGENPDKKLLRMCWQRCPHMNQITLQDTYRNLANNQYQIEIDEEVRLRALEAVELMLEIG
jgi:quinolinate synthase